jgi:hypothetical protein
VDENRVGKKRAKADRARPDQAGRGAGGHEKALERCVSSATTGLVVVSNR